EHKWIDILAEDLLNNRGGSILTVSGEHEPELHAAVAVLNKALGNDSATISFVEPPHFDQQNNTQAFIDAVEQMSTGSVDTVVMIGTNPGYTAPANLEFKKALEQVGTVLHLADHYDETSKLANWHVNKAHFLEAWGDGYSYTGD